VSCVSPGPLGYVEGEFREEWVEVITWNVGNADPSVARGPKLNSVDVTRSSLFRLENTFFNKSSANT
jgi:hypothetical protein